VFFRVICLSATYNLEWFSPVASDFAPRDLNPFLYFLSGSYVRTDDPVGTGRDDSIMECSTARRSIC